MNIRTKNDIALLMESESVECKKATGKDGTGKLPDTFWETYSAMANSNGGFVFLGLAEKDGRFSMAGLTSTESLRKQLADIANNHNKVSINLFTNNSFEEIEIDGYKVLQVYIPRARRQQRPVYLNNNPIGNSYRRIHEADQRMSDDEVNRFLAERVEDSRDTTILKGFTVKELDQETLRKYRQVYTVLHPDSSSWNGLNDLLFLEKIGGWRRDRETNEEGLTKAGLLMFGTHPVIQEVFPFYMLDYQEKDETQTTDRWIDRLTLDGGWSGNLYDFYHRVYSKLIVGLKTPFQLNGYVRIDDTPVHVALREALVNALVHADYSDRASVLVVKRPDMFGFRNPGLVRIPISVVFNGGVADCRNRLLAQMFRYVGIGEQAGSGIPKILDGWRRSHWRPPSLREDVVPYDQTLLELRMLDLFPPGTVEHLRRVFGKKYDELNHCSQIALALAFSEGTVSHERLNQLSDTHSADITQALHQLVDQQFLVKQGNTRDAVYHLPNQKPLLPDDIFGETSNSPILEPNSVVLNQNSPILEPNSPILKPNSVVLTKSGKEIRRNSDGCILSEMLPLPIIDQIDYLSLSFRLQLEHKAKVAAIKGKMPKEEMKVIILNLCENQYITLSALAKLLHRDVETLRGSYLTKMVKEGELALAFPAIPNHPHQAYTAGKNAEKNTES